MGIASAMKTETLSQKLAGTFKNIQQKETILKGGLDMNINVFVALSAIIFIAIFVCVGILYYHKIDRKHSIIIILSIVFWFSLVLGSISFL